MGGFVFMAYRVLTVEREFGSGGSRIAEKIAAWLGWRLINDEFIDAIAEAAHVDPAVVRAYDEQASTVLRRIATRSNRGAVNPVDPVLERPVFFNADKMAEFTRMVVDDAHVRGNCVLVGRGTQCILQHKPDVFHAFIYAPFHERAHRLQLRLEPGAHIEQRIRDVDQERADFILQRFGKVWNNHQLYNVMLSSSENEDRTARVLLYAMTGQL
jgi:cytidylate kinase